MRLLFSFAVLLCMAVSMFPSAGARPPVLEPIASPAVVCAPREAGDAEDTSIVWFGGDDENGAAYEDGIWNWDTAGGDPLQGWRGETGDAAFHFQWADAERFLAHGDGCAPLIGGTPGMLWCGVHEDEADALHYVAGMGYGNRFQQSACSPRIPFAPGEGIQLSFLYFNDTEPGFDYTCVLLESFDAEGHSIGEQQIASLTGVLGDSDDPRIFSATIPAESVPPGTDRVRFEIRFTSDSGWSDEDGEFATACGPFACDDVAIAVGAQAPIFYDFDAGPQGWTFERIPTVDSHVEVTAEEDWQAWTPPGCLLTAHVLGLYDGQHLLDHQIVYSGAIPRSALGTRTADSVAVRFCRYASRADYPLDGLRYRWGFRTCHEGAWSSRQGSSSWVAGDGACAAESQVIPDAALPAEWDSVQAVFEYEIIVSKGSRAAFVPPLLDDVQVGLVASAAVIHEGFFSASLHPIACLPSVFAGRTTIALAPNLPTLTRVTIVDPSGRLVRILASPGPSDGTGAEGMQVVWDGKDSRGLPVPSGLYWVCAEGGGKAARTAVIRVR